MVSVLEACRKRKRRPKVYGFHTFADPGCPISPTGPFRENVRVFLRECGETEDYSVEGMPIWCTLLLQENSSLVVPLYTIEEDVKHSENPFCDQCRCTGWSNHFVSKRKYHFIIPVDAEWNKPLEDGVFDLQTHLLHGLIHCNGFGHLICINGIEGGSKILCGREIMDLWDRICTNLRARKITVEDLSKKRSMDLRLLHGVAYGHSWFGRWGYRFIHGSFGVSEHSYDRAVETLCLLDLDKIIQDFSDTDQDREIKQIIHHYRDMSETHLITIQDLLRFMLTVKPRAPKQLKSMARDSDKSFPCSRPTRAAQQKKPSLKEKSPKYRKFSSVIAHMDSRWPARRLEYAGEVIVNALKDKKAGKSGSDGMTRQDLRDAARLHIGDTGLLDYVLKSMNNVIVGKHIVRRAVNPSTRIIEYTIHDLGNDGPEPEIVKTDSLASLGLAPGTDVYNDVVYLYTNVLLGYENSDVVELATQVVLDSKHFAKEWPFRDETDHLLRFICQAKPCLSEVENEFTREPPPGEIVELPLHATIGELKRAAENALRDTYCVMEGLIVEEINEMEEMGDEELLFGAIESGVEVWVRGHGIDSETQLRYQGGEDNWMVRCGCGARDDDGERMVACDVCEAWQHTRCCGIDDAETVPPLFVCPSCCVSLVPPRNESAFEFERCDAALFLPSTDYGWGSTPLAGMLL